MCTVDRDQLIYPNWFPNMVAAAAAANSFQSCPTLCDPIDGSHQALLSLGFSRQECWGGFLLLSAT